MHELGTGIEGTGIEYYQLTITDNFCLLQLGPESSSFNADLQKAIKYAQVHATCR